jgi:hypothetical protein
MITLPDEIPMNCGSIPEWGRNVFVLHSSGTWCPVTGWLVPYLSRRHDCFIWKDRTSSVQYKLAEIISRKPWPVMEPTKRRIVWVLVALLSAGGQVARTCSWTLTIQYQSWECMELWLHFNICIHSVHNGKLTFHLWGREALYFVRIETRVRHGNRGILVRFLEGQYISLFSRPSRTFLEPTQHLI